LKKTRELSENYYKGEFHKQVEAKNEEIANLHAELKLRHYTLEETIKELESEKKNQKLRMASVYS